MDLDQRSVFGLLAHFGTEMGLHRQEVRQASSVRVLATTIGRHIARLRMPFIIVVDEVDQLVRRHRGDPGGQSELDPLFSVPRLIGAPLVAIVAIANAVDLLTRGVASPSPLEGPGVETLLFLPYTTPQLREILKHRLASSNTTDAVSALSLELHVKTVGKLSGDCRRALSLCEIASRSSQETTDVEPMTPRKGVIRLDSRNDPLASLPRLPLEQLVLLCALVGEASEAASVCDIVRRYKELCKQLHQPPNLHSKGQVSSALSALEQRGLLTLRTPRTPRTPRSGARGRSSSCGLGDVAELAVPRSAVQERLIAANPVLATCMRSP